ncbi:MAG: 4-(cytidine 5'-diphospho)-2-C-methyl-D-erythritol kinase [Chloroflexi bacterium]|nr:4-(cytidine 5'-diphospho)-2-C-methyl-D-erythritol kinase [Chloroflexota bacterium]|tara:strand:+ start:2658 stop:3485 length:828 start_codon:yes stop_codon:yes gene_type:complete
MKIYSYAKINLVIEILSKLKNGYHDLRGIYQNISLRDEITIKESDKDSVDMGSGLIAEEDNIVYKAIKNFKRAYNLNDSFKVVISKNIPVSSGLGGGSSNASSVIMGINNILKLNIPVEELSLFSSKLGSDLPFFFKGGTCFVEGLGERVYKLNNLRNEFVYLYDPQIDIKNKTKKMFRSIDSIDYTDGCLTQKVKRKIQKNEYLKSGDYFNCFQNIAFKKFPKLSIKHEEMTEKFGNCFLTGAGMILVSISNQDVSSSNFQKYSIIDRGFDIDN